MTPNAHYALHLLALALLVIRSFTIRRLERALTSAGEDVGRMRGELLEQRAHMKRMLMDPRTTMREVAEAVDEVTEALR